MVAIRRALTGKWRFVYVCCAEEPALVPLIVLTAVTRTGFKGVIGGVSRWIAYGVAVAHLTGNEEGVVQIRVGTMRRRRSFSIDPNAQDQIMNDRVPAMYLPKF